MSWLSRDKYSTEPEMPINTKSPSKAQNIVQEIQQLHSKFWNKSFNGISSQSQDQLKMYPLLQPLPRNHYVDSCYINIKHTNVHIHTYNL